MECWVVRDNYDGTNFIFTDRDKLVTFLGEWAVNEQECGGDLKDVFSEVYLSQEKLNPDFEQRHCRFNFRLI